MPVTHEQSVTLLTTAYRAEVESRHREFIESKELRASIGEVAEFLTNPTYKFGLLMCGICGNGKTTMVRAMQNAISYLSKGGAFGRGIQYNLVIADAKDIVRKAKDYEDFVQIRNKMLLVIEDMGKEPTDVMDYGNILNPITDLIEYRYGEQMFTIITTNLTMKQIREKYGVRVADRCYEMMRIVVFEGGSYRR